MDQLSSARLVSLIIMAWVLCSGTASANPKYAAYVMHAETGDVLLDRYADQTRYPASLTKMMTLYLLFEALEEGKVTLDEKIVVSKRASLQPASKIGLQHGTTITVETAIKALVIKSANDVATAVAEKLATFESSFAKRMNAKARDLGMTRTTFRNASGLPDTRQRTTARDMAILSQRLVQDFPQYFHYFDDESFVWNGKKYTSHNKVTRNFVGADGLKTGYTRASGYNLSTTAERDGHRLIGIVLGGRSGRTRDQHMELILTNAFEAIETRPTLVKSIQRNRPVPGLRPDREKTRTAPTLMAAIESGPSLAAPVTQSSSDDSIAETLTLANARRTPLPVTGRAASTAQLEPKREIADLVLAEAVVSDTGPIGEGDADIDLMRTWVVQVGAFGTQPKAIAQIHATQEVVRDVWPDAGREVNIAQKGKSAIYRARFTRLTEWEASTTCKALKKEGQDCLALEATAN